LVDASVPWPTGPFPRVFPRLAERLDHPGKGERRASGLDRPRRCGMPHVLMRWASSSRKSLCGLVVWVPRGHSALGRTRRGSGCGPPWRTSECQEPVGFLLAFGARLVGSAAAVRCGPARFLR